MVFADPYREKAQRIKGVYGTKAYSVRNYYALLGVAYTVGCGYLFWLYAQTPRMSKKIERWTKSDSIFGIHFQPGDFTISPKLRHIDAAEKLRKIEAEKEELAVQAELARKSGVDVEAEPEMSLSARLAQVDEAAQAQMAHARTAER
ncbi:hypothetical protein RvY_03530 [Ramazzottius varieornatus]|uniref:Uncharacterized protein n=1 Tax=Ramazzottius varieornatus TaxID=947166 RepID=A0A1D1UND6_RAMVA|nr:hypothetical protein RvY_03530 [Ramazzottius varieornatus]